MCKRLAISLHIAIQVANHMAITAVQTFNIQIINNRKLNHHCKPPRGSGRGLADAGRGSTTLTPASQLIGGGCHDCRSERGRNGTQSGRVRTRSANSSRKSRPRKIATILANGRASMALVAPTHDGRELLNRARVGKPTHRQGLLRPLYLVVWDWSSVARTWCSTTCVNEL